MYFFYLAGVGWDNGGNGGDDDGGREIHRVNRIKVLALVWDFLDNLV